MTEKRALYSPAVGSLLPTAGRPSYLRAWISSSALIQKTLQSSKGSNRHILSFISTEEEMQLLLLSMYIKTSQVKLNGVNVIRTFPFPFPFLSYLYGSSGNLFACWPK